MHNWIIIIGWVFFFVFLILGLLSILSFIFERQKGAIVRGVLLLTLISCLFILLFISDFPAKMLVLLSIILFIVIFSSFIIISFHKAHSIHYVEMRHNMIRHAPESPIITESAFSYYENAKIALILAKYINLLGYEARAHVDGNYRVMCIPIAVDAGLGELGRLGLLITLEFGPRVRLSVVTTNLPLLQDQPIAFGVQHFCTICKKCAINCPTASIDIGEKGIHNGMEKGLSDQDNCYYFWRIQGTDCAICVKVCPYSYPLAPIHNLVRWVVRRNNFARRLAFRGDKFFYGRQPIHPGSFPAWHDPN